MTKSDKHRKFFAFGLSAIATAITLASAAATYSINTESFKDWGVYTARILAVMATIGIEATFALVLYAVANAITGLWEKLLSVVTLASLLAIMALNYTIHRQVVNGIALSDWQAAYYQWAGSLALFLIVVLIIAFKAVAHESRDRQMTRDIEHIGRQKALEWKRESLESPALADYLDSYRDQVFHEVRRTLQLPARTGSAATAEDQTRIAGFSRGDYDSKK